MRHRKMDGPLSWREITTCEDMSAYPTRGPTPADLAALVIDGQPATDEDKCDALAFLDALSPGKLRVAFFRSLVRGTAFTKADLARECGMSQPGVAKALARAAGRVWGESA